MIIIWGTKQVRTPMGRVADLCTRCRAIRCFRVERIGLASHIYYISFGQGRLAGYAMICEHCEGAFQANPADYKSLSQDPDAELDVLIRTTHPQVRQKFKDFSDFEDRLSSGNLTPDDRQKVFSSIIARHVSSIEARGAQTNLDFRSAMAILGMFVIPLAISVWAETFKGDGRTVMYWVAGGAAVVMLGFTIYLLATDATRYARRVVQPLLARDLRAYQPSLDELESALRAVQQIRPMARRIQSGAVHELVKKV